MSKQTIKVKVKHSGISSEKYLNYLKHSFSFDRIQQIAKESLDDFKKASPTLEIANNWSYLIKKDNRNFILSFENSTFKDGENIAIIIDIGHGTSSGKWIAGKNYLKEPIKKTYERINKLLMEAP